MASTEHQKFLIRAHTTQSCKASRTSISCTVLEYCDHVKRPWFLANNPVQLSYQACFEISVILEQSTSLLLLRAWWSANLCVGGEVQEFVALGEFSSIETIINPRREEALKNTSLCRLVKNQRKLKKQTNTKPLSSWDITPTSIFTDLLFGNLLIKRDILPAPVA